MVACILVLVIVQVSSTKRLTADEPQTSGESWAASYDCSSAGGISFNVSIAATEDVWFAGAFEPAVDFDPTQGTDVATTGQGFVSRLAADGSYQWTVILDAYVSFVAVNKTGDAWAVGAFTGTVDFDPTDMVDRFSASGTYSAFVTHLDANGEYLDTLALDGSFIVPSDVALAPTGEIVLTGVFAGTVDFDPGPGVDHRTAANGDIFVTKLDIDGAAVWTRTMGGGGIDDGDGVAIDSDGNVFVVGTFRGSVDFDPGPAVARRTASSNYWDVFVLKLNDHGNFLWVRTYPLNGAANRPATIAVDADGNVIIASNFVGTMDLDSTDGVDLRTVNDAPSGIGPGDFFVTKLAADGSYCWTYTAGGPSQDLATDVAVGPNGTIYVLGIFRDQVDFAADRQGGKKQARFGHDGFVLALAPDGTFQSVRTTAGLDVDGAESLAVDIDGNVIIAVAIPRGSIDIDPSCEVDPREVRNCGNTFIVKMRTNQAADIDADSDVDLVDLAAFQNCYTGDPRDKHSDPLPVDCDAGCDEFDLSPDGVLDRDDYALLRKRFEGPK